MVRSAHAYRRAPSLNFSALSLIAYTLVSQRLCFLIAFAQWFRAESALFIQTHALLTLFRRLNRVARNEVAPYTSFFRFRSPTHLAPICDRRMLYTLRAWRDAPPDT